MDDKRRLILDQALALVDERGLAAMSMRAVAERVGLTSMALYPYVGGKDALLDGLVDLLNLELGDEVGDGLGDNGLGDNGLGDNGLGDNGLGDNGLGDNGLGDGGAEPDWRRRLRALGRAVRGLAARHPGAFPLLLNRSAAGASTSWLTAALRGVLHDAGVPAGHVPRLARMIVAFLLGYATGEVTGGLPAPATPEAGQAEFEADLSDLVRLVETAVRVA
ncbi:helix-turn-helix domain-containing protein [Actinoplanes sp. M2I2]|uniref:TetR/AcrR family transcriptional regulator n=1 Tax=Actinoplanes sp. M2I2 TaxID=1734444 RepID=UPI002020FA5E|nr:helix-turn-helix domain-containing protein [Actinoplanes sp. M2I2]